jgi:hypothetical protein
MAAAASVETRVRVERFEKVRAMDLPAREDVKWAGRELDLAAVLWAEALRTRAVSS